MSWSVRKVHFLLRSKYLPNCSQVGHSFCFRRLCESVSSEYSGAPLEKSWAKATVSECSVSSVNTGNGEDLTCGEESTSGGKLTTEEDLTRGEAEAEKDANAITPGVVTGDGVLRATSGDYRSELRRMRLDMGKVKGKVKSKVVPVEVIKRNKHLKPWKSWNHEVPGYTSRSAQRSYQNHSDVVANTYSRKKHLYLAGLNNTNFLHKKFGLSRGEMKEPEAMPSVLGLSEEETQSKMQAMKVAGFTDEEARALVWGFPQCLAVDWSNLYRTVRYLMGEAGLSLSVVAALVEKHPYMFTRNSDKVISGRGTSGLGMGIWRVWH